MTVLWMVGGLLVLVGVSIFSALALAKRTDRLVMDEDEGESSPVFRVRFPDQVFRVKNA